MDTDINPINSRKRKVRKARNASQANIHTSDSSDAMECPEIVDAGHCKPNSKKKSKNIMPTRSCSHCNAEINNPRNTSVSSSDASNNQELVDNKSQEMFEKGTKEMNEDATNSEEARRLEVGDYSEGRVEQASTQMSNSRNAVIKNPDLENAEYEESQKVFVTGNEEMDRELFSVDGTNIKHKRQSAQIGENVGIQHSRQEVTENTQNIVNAESQKIFEMVQKEINEKIISGDLVANVKEEKHFASVNCSGDQMEHASIQISDRGNFEFQKSVEKIAENTPNANNIETQKIIKTEISEVDEELISGDVITNVRGLKHFTPVNFTGIRVEQATAQTSDGANFKNSCATYSKYVKLESNLMTPFLEGKSTRGKDIALSANQEIQTIVNAANIVTESKVVEQHKIQNDAKDIKNVIMTEIYSGFHSNQVKIEKYEEKVASFSDTTIHASDGVMDTSEYKSVNSRKKKNKRKKKRKGEKTLKQVHTEGKMDDNDPTSIASTSKEFDVKDKSTMTEDGDSMEWQQCNIKTDDTMDTSEGKNITGGKNKKRKKKKPQGNVVDIVMKSEDMKQQQKYDEITLPPVASTSKESHFRDKEATKAENYGNGISMEWQECESKADDTMNTSGSNCANNNKNKKKQKNPEENVANVVVKNEVQQQEKYNENDSTPIASTSKKCYFTVAENHKNAFSGKRQKWSNQSQYNFQHSDFKNFIKEIKLKNQNMRESLINMIQTRLREIEYSMQQAMYNVFNDITKRHDLNNMPNQ